MTVTKNVPAPPKGPPSTPGIGFEDHDGDVGYITPSDEFPDMLKVVGGDVYLDCDDVGALIVWLENWLEVTA